MPPEKSLKELFADWGFVPKLFGDDNKVAREQVTPINPENLGFAGPRARLAIPAGFNDQSLDVDAIIQNTVEKKLSKIVIAYPTDYDHLRRRRQYIKFDDKIHWQELERIYSKLLPQAKEFVSKAREKNITVEFLPMAKLTEGSALRYHFGSLSPIRFWTAKQPAHDAAYVLFDDIISKGSTFSGMLSLLTHQGVPQENLIGTITGNEDKKIALSQAQMQAIDTLYNQQPDVANRADIILQLIGIDGLKALNNSEADHLLYDNDHKLSLNQVDNLFKLIYKKINTYDSIPEPNQGYVDKLKNVGLSTKTPKI